MPSVAFPKLKTIDISGLHEEIAKVISIDGVTDKGTGVSIERDTPFTPAEVSVLQSVIDAHDASAVLSKRRARIDKQKAEKEKDPKTLTDRQRIERIEVIFGID